MSNEVEGWAAKDTESFQPKTMLDELSFAELMEMSSVHIQDIDELTQADKEALVGVPLFLLGWNFKSGDYGPTSEFAFVTIRTMEGLQWFTDGSTGILAQLHRYQTRMEREGIWQSFCDGELGGIRVPHGLRVSQYQWTDPLDGIDKPASTFYLDNRDR